VTTSDALTTDYQARSPQGKVAFAVLLSFAMMASTIAVPSFSVLSSFLLDDLGIGRTQLGWLVTVVSGVTAGLSPVAGRIADALGGRTTVLALFAMSVVVTLAIATAGSYGILLGVAVVAGILNSTGNPGTNKLIASAVPQGARGIVMGVKQSGVQAGIFLLGVLLPPLALALGWRTAVALVAAAPGLGLVLAARLLPSDRPTPSAAEASDMAADHPAAIRWIASYAFLMGAGNGGVMSFVPLYTQEELGFGVAAAGAAAATIGLVGVLSRIGWGTRVERVRHFALPLGLLAVLAAVSSASIGLAATTAWWLLWLGVLLAGVSVSAWNAVAMLAAVNESRVERAGRSSGLVVLGFMGGFTTSPVLFGYAVDATGSYALGWTGVTAAFMLGALLMVLWRLRTPAEVPAVAARR